MAEEKTTYTHDLDEIARAVDGIDRQQSDLDASKEKFVSEFLQPGNIVPLAFDGAPIEPVRVEYARVIEGEIRTRIWREQYGYSMTVNEAAITRNVRLAILSQQFKKTVAR